MNGLFSNLKNIWGIYGSHISSLISSLASGIKDVIDKAEPNHDEVPKVDNNVIKVLNKGFITTILTKSHFPIRFDAIPLFVVIRETDFNLSYVPNDGRNLCDTIILIDDKNFIKVSGRSFPHINYLKKFGYKGSNYIASSYIRRAWRKGTHRGYRALVQNVSFKIWRSSDLVLKNADDKFYYSIVADNLHAHAPWSAGCVTIHGTPDLPSSGQKLSGDWKIVDDWIYNTHASDTFFDACILEHKDVEIFGQESLRFGSSGNLVKKVQSIFGEKVDGDFGPVLFSRVTKWQEQNGFPVDGILWPEQLKLLLK